MTVPPGASSRRFRPLRFRPGYAWATAILLAIEVVIALFVEDRFVRPYLGDSLAVALVYCAIRATLDLRPVPAAALALAVAAAIEFGQYFQVLHLLGLERNAIAATLLGSSFAPGDFVAYAVGAIGVLVVEAAGTRARPSA